MQLLFYKNDILEGSYQLNTEDFKYSFIDNDIKTIITIKPNIIVEREGKDYYFKLDLVNNSCIYQLIDYNLTYDIEILKKSFSEKDNVYIIEYQLNTDRDLIKLIIKNEE